MSLSNYNHRKTLYLDGKSRLKQTRVDVNRPLNLSTSVASVNSWRGFHVDSPSDRRSRYKATLHLANFTYRLVYRVLQFSISITLKCLQSLHSFLIQINDLTETPYNIKFLRRISAAQDFQKIIPVNFKKMTLKSKRLLTEVVKLSLAILVFRNDIIPLNATYLLSIRIIEYVKV